MSIVTAPKFAIFVQLIVVDNAVYRLLIFPFLRLLNMSNANRNYWHGMLDLDEMTEKSFEPVPSSPQVVPVDGKLEIRCRPPAGLPRPAVRSFSSHRSLHYNLL